MTREECVGHPSGIIVELDPDFSVRPPPNAHVVNLDAQTGAVVWNQDTGSPFSDVLNGNQAVGPDGTLYSFLTPAADGATGAPVSSPYSPVQVPNSSAAIQVAPQNPCSSVTKSFPPGFAPPTIDADGSVLTLTAQSNLVYTSTCTGTGSLVQLSATYYLARVTPSGSYALTPYYTQTNANILPAQPAPQLSPYACLEVFIQTTFEGCRVAVGTNSLIVQSLAPTVEPFRPIPDGQGGALIPARIQDPNNPGAALAHVFHIPSSGPVVDIVIPLPAPGVQQTILNTGTRNFDLVLGENNVAFATDGINLASFNFTTAQILWTYQSSSISKAVGLIASVTGNSLVTKISDISNTSSFGQESVLRFDSSGHATYDVSQTPTPPAPFASLMNASWTGDLLGLALQSSSAAHFSATIVDWTHSFWGAPAGSPTPSNASVEMPWFPPLPSCPGSQTPCAREALENAFTSLTGLLSSNCSNCQSWVFSKSQLGLTQTSFLSYLQKGHYFYDATRSYAPANKALCVEHSVFNIFAEPCPVDNTPLKDVWQREEPAALSKTPSPKGMVTFFDPAQINIALGGSDGAKQNQATIFHEALHGSTGLVDNSPFAINVTLESIFGICFQPSQAITTYLSFHIFGIGAAPTCP